MSDDEKATRAQPDIPWLGSRRFWLVLAGIVVVVFGYFVVKRIRYGSTDAVVPIVSLAGPSEVTPNGAGTYFILVRNRDGAAIPNASVKLALEAKKSETLATGTTNDAGEAVLKVTFPAKFESAARLKATASAGVLDSEAWIAIHERGTSTMSVLVTTDKPLYQPGQTIHVRALTMREGKPVGGRRSIIEVRTEDGIKVFREEKESSAFGVVTTDFELADQVKLGRYTINVETLTPTRPNPREVSARGARQVNVQRYTLPKLKLALEDLGPLRAAAPLKGTAHATWIFGEPVTKGTVKVALVHPSGSERTFIGQVDKEGKVRFELAPKDGLKPSEQPKGSFTLTAKLDVEGGLHAEATKSLTSIEGDLKVEAFAESGALIEGVEQNVFVIVDHDLRANAQVLVNGTRAAKTDEHGIARVLVTPDPTSTVFTAYTTDNTVGNAKLMTTKDALVIRTEQQVFAAGATAKLRVFGAPAGDRIAVRLSNHGEPLGGATCVPASTPPVCEVSLPIPEGVSGLVWAHALSLPQSGTGRVRSGKHLVMVDGGGRDLTIDAKPDKPFYAPRDIGTMSLAVTGAAGKPVKAQLGVSVADEAVFALADVRPDLERLFFVVDDDARSARAEATRSTEVPMPGSLDRRAVYSRGTAESIRGTTLAILTTMKPSGAFEDATFDDVRSHAERNLRAAKRRLLAWFVVTMTVLALIAFALFGVYGVERFRRPVPVAASEEEKRAFLLDTRALLTDWILAVLGPPILGVFASGMAEVFSRSSSNEEGIILGSWAVLTILSTIPLVRSVLRVRKTPLASELPLFQRIVPVLPASTFLGQLSILLVLGDKAERVRELFDERESGLFFVLAIAVAAQLSFGLLSVVRQTILREVSTKGRVWLFASRAAFLGLPVTLVLLTVLGRSVRKKASFAGDAEPEEAAPSSADNKEGGTGTRARGEEGSMGNAAFAKNARDDDALTASPKLRVRDYFPETLLWAPEVFTDDQGHATMKVPFADSITTWRFNVNAVSEQGQLGNASLPLVVKQDFFVEAVLPPTLTQSDEVAVPLTVFSYLDTPQDVTLELEGDGMSAIGPKQRQLRLLPKEARGVRFSVRADKAGDRLVRVKAISAARADAVERKVIVVPNGEAIIKTTNGRVSGTMQGSLELPQNAIEGGNDLHIKVYGGPLSQVVEGLDGVFHMPHGCFEQTSSTTYPSVLVLDFLKRSKAVRPDVEKRARGYIVQGYQRLVSFEVKGGGFSLFGSEPAQTSLTAYGLLEFADMARVATVDEGLVARARSWLFTKRLSSGFWGRMSSDQWNRPVEVDDPLLTAYVAWALSASLATETSKDPRIAQALDLVERQSGADAEDPYSLALRANALLAGGRPATAKLLLEKLAPQAIKNEEGTHWTSKTTGVMYSSGASMDIEVTGLATHALALAEMQPELRAGALDWIVRRRTPRGTWSTTQATIAAMRALLDEARPAAKEAQEVTVLVDGQTANVFKLEPDARDVHRLIDLRRYATTGKHAVEVKASGQGDVSYQLVATHYLPWKAPERGGLSLDVTYAGNTVAPGTTTSARVRLAWKGKTPAVMPLVEIGIPPSFEIETDVLERLLEAGTIQRFAVERGKLTLYLASLAEDKPLGFELSLRATRTAKVVAPSSAAYLYYEPEVRTETAPATVRSL